MSALPYTTPVRQAAKSPRCQEWSQDTSCNYREPSKWCRHQMETFSALLALCAGNLSATGEIPSQRPVAQNFGVFVDLRLNKRYNKQPWGWLFESQSRSLWRHYNDHQKKFWDIFRTQFIKMPKGLYPYMINNVYIWRPVDTTNM